LECKLWLSWMRMRYVRQQEVKGKFREICRHQTLNRNANVLTKSGILRNASPWRSGSTCPENLSSRNWIFLVKYSLRIPTSVHITPGSPILCFRSLFHLRPSLSIPLPWRSLRDSDPSTNLADPVYRSKLKIANYNCSL